MDWHAQTKEEIFKKLKTSEKGLTKAEAKKRLKKYRKNVIKTTKRLSYLKIFISQFNSFLIYILILAAVISFVIGHFLDGIVISAIVLINAFIGFFQEYKAEKAISKLKKLIIPQSKVMREGKLMQISSLNLVPGDVVVLSLGDKVNADARILEIENLQTNEAILTGESMPVTKSLKTLSKSTVLAERENMLFTGTQIARGNAKAIVVDTGMQTVFGKIAESLQEINIQKTPMQKRLNVLSKQIGFVVLALVVLVMLLGLLETLDYLEMFMIAVSLAVSAIPEGLPAVLAMSFAISSLIMSKKNVIIRRLPAVESLGSVTVICSDKTGTITEEKMTLKKIFVNDSFYDKKGKEIFDNKKVDPKKNKELSQLFKIAVLCNNARFEITDGKYEILGDSTEAALLSAALDLKFNKKTLTEKEPGIKEFEFTSTRKMMSVVRGTKNKAMYSKGALEKILTLCKYELINGKTKPLTEKRKKEILASSKKMEKEAYRVLGFAYKEIKNKIEEKDLIFIGFAGMIDPPRKEVKSAVNQCKRAGINVKMITGDSLLTAKSIADQVGIKGKAIEGKQLEKMSEASLLDSISEISVFARITPAQKLRITNILQKKEQVVAITGDGINDVLALKSADIGIAMGQRGTDVARDVSDVVLVDDNFASIVEGVKQGRKTYDNIKKFTKYFFAVNFSEIFLILFALIMGMLYNFDTWFLPLLPLQILWINLVTDSLPALALVFEKQEDVMSSKPRQEKSILDKIWKFIIIAGIFTLLIEVAIYLIGINAGFSPEKTRSILLTTAILFELFFVYTCRSKKSLFKIGPFSNKWLNYAVIISILLHLILLYTPLGGLFGVIPLALRDWLFILPFAISGIFVFEIAKLLKKTKKQK
jgi:Ca2+-transporting ATPase